MYVYNNYKRICCVMDTRYTQCIQNQLIVPTIRSSVVLLGHVVCMPMYSYIYFVQLPLFIIYHLYKFLCVKMSQAHIPCEITPKHMTDMHRQQNVIFNMQQAMLCHCTHNNYAITMFQKTYLFTHINLGMIFSLYACVTSQLKCLH